MLMVYSPRSMIAFCGRSGGLAWRVPLRLTLGFRVTSHFVCGYQGLVGVSDLDNETRLLG
jgi:hypothetical protein